MRKLLLLFFSVTFLWVTGCAVSSKNSVKNTETRKQEALKVKEECKNYVSQMEKCLKTAKGKDYRKVWKECEGQVMWDMLKEYQDNGFCFDEDECKQKVLDEINRCLDERNALFRKHMK
ncbi:MAG: hypothetical protein Q9M89_04030 [Persephonella sp.]|nr:hypothetical protein [Persephonella sp.]